jgi:hypothetical protein
MEGRNVGVVERSSVTWIIVIFALLVLRRLLT